MRLFLKISLALLFAVPSFAATTGGGVFFSGGFELVPSTGGIILSNTTANTILMVDSSKKIVSAQATFVTNGTAILQLPSSGNTNIVRGLQAHPSMTTNVQENGWMFPPPDGSLMRVIVSGTNVYLTNVVVADLTSLIAGSETGSHASPTTTNPLSPTWVTAMHTVWYGATGTINLPAAAGYSGRGILVYNTGSFTITIDSNGSEVIVRDGTVQTGGVNFTLSSGAGNYVFVFCDGTRWITLGYKGTLALGS